MDVSVWDTYSLLCVATGKIDDLHNDVKQLLSKQKRQKDGKVFKDNLVSGRESVRADVPFLCMFYASVPSSGPKS